MPNHQLMPWWALDVVNSWSLLALGVRCCVLGLGKVYLVLLYCRPVLDVVKRGLESINLRSYCCCCTVCTTSYWMYDIRLLCVKSGLYYCTVYLASNSMPLPQCLPERDGEGERGEVVLLL